jgi:cytoskeletal protein RodZ
MQELLIVSAVLGMLGVVAWIALLVWAAIEDGSAQNHRERHLDGTR